MKPEEVEYVQYRLSRATEALDEAGLLMESEHLSTAVSRLYYACFYSVSALLYTDGLSSSKHSGVRSLFNQHWIKTGRLPVEMGRFYQRLFDRRQEGDYGDIVAFAPQDVKKWFDQAREFVRLVSEKVTETCR